VRTHSSCIEVHEIDTSHICMTSSDTLQPFIWFMLYVVHHCPCKFIHNQPSACASHSNSRILQPLGPQLGRSKTQHDRFSLSSAMITPHHIRTYIFQPRFPSPQKLFLRANDHVTLQAPRFTLHFRSSQSKRTSLLSRRWAAGRRTSGDGNGQVRFRSSSG
jgi:hypothetical protein